MRGVVLGFVILLAACGAARAAETAAPAGTPAADPDAALNMCLTGSGKDQKALIEACTAALTRTDLSPTGIGVLHQRRGTAAFQIQDMDMALDDYSQAVLADPKDDAAQAGRGIVYYGLGEYAQAIHDLTTALELNPQHPFARSIRGICYVRIDSFKAAIDDLSSVIDGKSGGTAMDYYNRGLAYQGLKDKGKAKADFKQCLKLLPDQAACKQALSAL